MLESHVHLQEDMSQQGHAITMVAASVYGEYARLLSYMSHEYAPYGVPCMIR